MKTIIFLSALALTTAAFAQNPSPTPVPAPSVSGGVDMTHSSEGMPAHNDAQIAAIVKTANDTDINGGKMAEKMATRKDVKDFAKEMIRDHSAANAKLEKLVAKNKMAVTENDNSRGMKKMADETMKHLKSVKKTDFDREYMDSELTMHKDVLTALDNDLIPHAQNADLKKLLADVRETVNNHLEKAKVIDTAITSAR